MHRIAIYMTTIVKMRGTMNIKNVGWFAQHINGINKWKRLSNKLAEIDVVVDAVVGV